MLDDGGDEWRLIAGSIKDAPLRARAQAWVHDVRLGAGRTLDLPSAATSDVLRLLYVFAGCARLAGATLAEGESALLDAEDASVTVDMETNLVLLSTDTAAPVFTCGMFSGNSAGAGSRQ